MNTIFHNTSHKTFRSKKQCGFTVVELIIIIAIISIFASIALPDLATTFARSSLKEAGSTTALALRKAKNIARSRNTSVSVNFVENSSDITLTLPDNSVIQTVTLDNVLSESNAVYKFNSIGTVDSTGTIFLKSSLIQSLKKSVVIATLSGQIRTY